MQLLIWTKRASLRLAGLAADGVEVQRAQLQLAVDASREPLAQVLALLRLGAVGEVAARRLGVALHVLEQPLADLRRINT